MDITTRIKFDEKVKQIIEKCGQKKELSQIKDYYLLPKNENVKDFFYPKYKSFRIRVKDGQAILSLSLIKKSEFYYEQMKFVFFKGEEEKVFDLAEEMGLKIWNEREMAGTIEYTYSFRNGSIRLLVEGHSELRNIVKIESDSVKNLEEFFKNSQIPKENIINKVSTEIIEMESVK